MSATIERAFNHEAQRLDALKRANRTRLANAELKRHIYSLSSEEGRAMAADVVREPSRPAKAMGLDQLLLSVRGLGHRKLSPLLRELGVSAHIQLGLLTPGQRRRVEARLLDMQPFRQDNHGERRGVDPWRAKLDAEMENLRRENQGLRDALAARSHLQTENDALRRALDRMVGA